MIFNIINQNFLLKMENENPPSLKPLKGTFLSNLNGWMVFGFWFCN